MDLSTFQAALDQDPQYQHLAQQAQASLTQKDPGQLFNSRPGQGQSSTAFMALQAYASQKAQQLGFDMTGYTPGYTGQIQKEAPTDWGRALLALTPLAGGLGAAAMGVGGGFTGAGAGATAGSAAPGIADLGALGPNSIGGAAGAVSAPLAGDVGTVAGSGIGTAAGAAAGGVSNTVKALTTLASVLGGKGIAAATGGVPSQLTDLLNNAVQRQNQQKALGVAVDQGMYKMLPNYATQGVGSTPTGAAGLKALFGGS